MKKLSFIIVILIAAFASCVKDRVQPISVTPPVVVPAGDTLMYFWSFNGQDSSNRKPDFAVSGHTAYFNYFSSYIDFTTGSSLNLYGTFDSGTCLRVRNPSDSLVFYMPTTGYDSVILSYAEEASSTTSGSTLNDVSYTTDGVNWVTTASPSTQYQYNVDITFAVHSFNFSSDAAVNNNPKFAVKIRFDNNNTGTSGNDRFDNVSLLGVRKP